MDGNEISELNKWVFIFSLSRIGIEVPLDVLSDDSRFDCII